MMNKKKIIQIIFLVSCLFIVATGALIYFFQQSPLHSSESELGTLLSFSGTVKIKSSDNLKWIEAKEKMNLYHLDTLETHNGEGKIKLQSGHIIKIHPFTLVSFEEWNTHSQKSVLLIPLHGRYEVIQKGRDHSLFFSIGGQIVTDEQLANKISEPQTILESKTQLPDKEPQTDSSFSPTTETPLEPSPSVKTQKPTSLKIINEDTGELTNEYITEKLSESKDQFTRCYANLLGQDLNAKGKLIVNFTIFPSGKTSNMKIISTQFSNNDFHQCLITVISRLTFQSYKGNSIIANYPLNFY